MENTTFKIIDKNQIPDYEYQGYYWFSNSPKPVILNYEKFEINILTELPFVVEGNLYAPLENISIQIKNIDGVYYIALIDLSNTNGYQISQPQKYLGHDLGFDYYLVQAWELVEDDQCNGLETFVPAFTAFKGFVEPKNEK